MMTDPSNGRERHGSPDDSMSTEDFALAFRAYADEAQSDIPADERFRIEHDFEALVRNNPTAYAEFSAKLAAEFEAATVSGVIATGNAFDDLDIHYFNR